MTKEMDFLSHDTIEHSVDTLVSYSHGTAIKCGWYGQDKYDVQDYIVNKLNVPTKLCLIHSEISEAMEGHRKGLMDDKLPHRPMIEVELADAIIRICDLAGALDLDLGGAVAEKLAFNLKREDHKPEARAQEGGKKY